MSKIVIYKQYVVKKLEGSKRTNFQTRYSSTTSVTSKTSNSHSLQKGGVPLLYLDLRQSYGRAATETPFRILQKGGVPAAPSGTATLLRLSPNHRYHPRPTLAVTDFKRPRLSWLDGRCVQGPGTYSPRHG